MTTETHEAATQQKQRPPGFDLAVRMLKQYETASLFEQIEAQITLIEQLEVEIAEDKEMLVAAHRTMDTARYEKQLAGVAGKNETERKAALERALADDELYARAQQEIDGANSRIAIKESGLRAGQRRYTAMRLEAEARIASKNLLAGLVKS